MLPIAIAPAVEHVGGIMAISSVTGKDFLKKPGLHRTLLGDGVATAAASLIGGPPNTTYAEVTGAVMLTRNFNPNIMDLGCGMGNCNFLLWKSRRIPFYNSNHRNGWYYDVGIRFKLPLSE